MIPTPATIEEKEVVPQSHKIEPHVAHLVLKNLKDVSEDWWGEIKQMLNSTNILDRKFAITEINKIQLKSMPTNLSAEEGVNIQVNIVQYGDQANSNPVQLPPKEVSGTIIDGDGLGDKKGSKHLAQKSGKR